MSKVIDVSGERFGQLMCIRKMYVKNKNSYWLCKCDCGKETIVSLNNLRRLHTKSCGCYKEERIKRQNRLCRSQKKPDARLYMLISAKLSLPGLEKAKNASKRFSPATEMPAKLQKERVN